jgi:hypothetical protein
LLTHHALGWGTSSSCSSRQALQVQRSSGCERMPRGTSNAGIYPVVYLYAGFMLRPWAVCSCTQPAAVILARGLVWGSALPEACAVVLAWGGVERCRVPPKLYRPWHAPQTHVGTTLGILNKQFVCQ